MHPHLPGDETVHHVPVLQPHLKRCVGQVLNNLALHLDQVFLGHPISPALRHP